MKKINLLGIRKRAILCRIKAISVVDLVVMQPITKEDEEYIDENEEIVINNNTVIKHNIYCYGEINLSSVDDVEYIKKFNLIDSEEGGIIHSNFNYEEGCAEIEKVAKTYPTFNPIDWFKYNYCLIGKPERIIIYKCKKEDL